MLNAPVRAMASCRDDEGGCGLEPPPDSMGANPAGVAGHECGGGGGVDFNEELGTGY